MTARTLIFALSLAVTTAPLMGACLSMDFDGWGDMDDDYTYDYDDSYWEDYGYDYEYAELALQQPALSGVIGPVVVGQGTTVTAEGYTDDYSVNLTLLGESDAGGSMLILSFYTSDGLDALEPGVYSGYDDVSVMGCAGESLEFIDLDIMANETVVEREDHADGSTTITVTATFPRYDSEGGAQVLTGSVTTTP